MTWKNELKRCLAEYSDLKKGVSTVTIRINEIDKVFNANTNRAPLNDAYLNMQAEHSILKANLQRAESIVGSVERALSQLDETQRLILNEMYIKRRPDWETYLGSILNYQRRSIYTEADKALRAFGTAYYLLPAGYI